MSKIIYETILNNKKCSIELLDIEKDDNADNIIFGYFIGSTGGLAHGNDLLRYIVALETKNYLPLKNCSSHAISFINDLVREGILDKETYCKMYEDGAKTYEFLTS